MARRSDHTRDELNSLILESAFNMVEKGGYSSVSTRKIAQEIGYTVGTLYNTFTNLDDIFLHLNARIIDLMLNRIKHAVSDTKTPKEAVESLAKQYLKFCKEKYNLWNLLFEYRFPENTVFPSWYNQKITEIYSYVESITSNIDSAQGSDKKVFTGIFWSGIHGICALAIKGKLGRLGFLDAELMINEFLKKY